ncbi:SUKH-4 family immunity protein [Spirillospora sp. NPDC050679]
MTTDIAGRAAAHFGPRGLRRLTPDETRDLPLPEDAVRALTEIGLPVQAGPYFTAAVPGEPLPLAGYAALKGLAGNGPADAGRFRLGGDHGAEICATPQGVEAVFVAVDADPTPVNSSVPAFLACLLALDEHLPIMRTPGDRDPAAVYRSLREALLEIDGPALADDEAWWPMVLEQVRHAMSFPFSVAFEVEDVMGDRRIETEQARPGFHHPERVLWDRLSAKGVRPAQVTRIYTELEPCFLPGNYCATWLTRFPRAEFSYSFDYGDTAEEREQGLLALMRHAAEQD